MKKIIISFIFAFVLSGCFNYNELNNYDIVEAISIDYDNGYIVGMMSGNNYSNKKKNYMYQAKNKTFYDALKDVSKMTPHKLYLGHISVMIIDEEVAKKGLYSIVNSLLNNKQINKDFYIILAKNTNSSNILSKSSTITDYPAQYIANNIKTTNKLSGDIKAITFNDLVKKLINKENPVINGYIIKNNNIKIDSLGYFKDDRLIGWTTKKESYGINIINNDIDKLYIRLNCLNDYTIININNMKSKLSINKSGNIKIKVTGSAGIENNNCSMNIKDIEKKANNKIKYYIMSSISLSNSNNIDLFGFNKLYYQNYKKYTNKKWNNFDKRVHIKVKDNGILNGNIGRIRNEKDY